MVKKKNKFGCYIFIVCQYDVECKSNLSLNDTFVTPFYEYDDLSDADILIRLKLDKAYNRIENSARHLWPMYFHWRGSALIASIGSLAYVFSIKWWLLLTVLIPFILEACIASKTNYNIYAELETYWKKERKYSTLGGYLRSRNFSRELKAYGNYDYLIDTYKNRLNERNRDYERYYFRNLRKILFGNNITKIGSIANVIILLVLFVNGQISVGLFIAMSGLMFG